jgi:hypothetical protein
MEPRSLTPVFHEPEFSLRWLAQSNKELKKRPEVARCHRSVLRALLLELGADVV